jgi:hypothetical protein
MRATSSRPRRRRALSRSATSRGSTRLFSEARFRFGTEIARGCVRGYPFRYYTKSDAGRIVASTRRILIIAPPGATPATGPWCAPDGPCW